jgi:hypothetical protein
MVRFDSGMKKLLKESFEAGGERIKNPDKAPTFEDWLELRFNPNYVPEKKESVVEKIPKRKKMRWIKIG